MDLLTELRKNPFVLAPMAGVTDNAFRSFIKDLGAGIVITELVSAHALNLKDQKTLSIAKFEKTQSPIGVQLFGHDPTIMSEASKICEQLGFDFIDINMGCPVKKITAKGSGSALLKDLDLVKKIISHIKSSISIPLTIKIRSGWDDNSKNATEICNIAHNEGVSWISIHARTRAQAFSGKADWNYIKLVKENSKIPLIGNGDITDARQAVQYLKQYNCDGIMIGRGCLKKPTIFVEAINILSNKPNVDIDHKTLLNKLHKKLELHLPPKLVLIQLKKFSTWFSFGYPESAQFRKEVFTKKNVPEVIELCQNFFLQTKGLTRQLNKEFMMSGHG